MILTNSCVPDVVVILLRLGISVIALNTKKFGSMANRYLKFYFIQSEIIIVVSKAKK